MGQPFRLSEGGTIDRSRELWFTFDGRRYSGHPGDTVASALLANGLRCVGRSFKYHRPRGVFSAGPEEPNALLRIGSGGAAEPNTRATMQLLQDGLVAASQNGWPSTRFDVRRLHDWLSPVIPAGFYYKTFMWPRRGWMTYERHIRRAAGMGSPVFDRDPDWYAHRHAQCDVMVVGGGAAGLAAALAAGRAGADVILVDEHDAMGGQLRFERRVIDGLHGSAWADRCVDVLAATENVRLLRCTTAFGVYDHRTVALVERVTGTAETLPDAGAPRQRRWLVRCGHIVVATGSIERPIVFSGNDLPGVMLASAARCYVNRFAVAPGRRSVVFTNNTDAYRTAFDLARAGLAVAAIVDARPNVDVETAALARNLGIEVLHGHTVRSAHGQAAVARVVTAPLDGGNDSPQARRAFDCDLLCVSGGFSPSVHLYSQIGGKLTYDERLAAFVPGDPLPGMTVVGAARGTYMLAECLREGTEAGTKAAHGDDVRSHAAAAAPICDHEPAWSLRALWQVGGAKGKRFVDLQDDVTVDDVALAVREGYRPIEHVKRYTTLGMGTDQGKTSNMNGLAIVAELTGSPIPAVGTTTFRPPYTPVSFGALAGPRIGEHLAPTRLSPLHEWHAAHRATWIQAGPWLRPRAYVRDGDSFQQAWQREVLTVRRAVGLCDVSTLGKIDVQGPDALTFLDRVYCNNIASLQVGRCRYGLMLREDGIVFDDGTVARTAEQKFYVTTTTGNAAAVMAHLEFLSQTAWPELRVSLTSVTDQYAQIAVAGPASRAVLARATNADLGNQTIPHLATIESRIADVAVRVFRISFSGELAYEIASPADHADRVWEHLLQTGAGDGIAPYGIEAVTALRIEKGHIAGAELDGRTTPGDLGLGRFVSRRKDFVGRHMLQRPGLTDPGRKGLVGLEPVDGMTPVPAGAQLIADTDSAPPLPMQGHVTSATFSPTLGRPIALALLSGGVARAGEVLVAASPLIGLAVRVRVVLPAFYDPEGVRLLAE
ncbi:MAG: sarcosine oxidase subunit alpha family protein [Betaproteobacteria bacterium]